MKDKKSNNTLNDPHDDESVEAEVGRQRREKREDWRDQDAETEDPFTAENFS